MSKRNLYTFERWSRFTLMFRSWINIPFDISGQASKIILPFLKNQQKFDKKIKSWFPPQSQQPLLFNCVMFIKNLSIDEINSKIINPSSQDVGTKNMILQEIFKYSWTEFFHRLAQPCHRLIELYIGELPEPHHSLNLSIAIIIYHISWLESLETWCENSWGGSGRPFFYLL